MKKKKSINKQLQDLENKYLKDIAKIIKNCNHKWKEDGYENGKYNGTQYYRCSQCGERKDESY
jgi:transposase-like protein